MRFGVLGPLTANGDNGPVALGGPRERTLLAYLLSRANQVVSIDALVDALWGEAAPARAGKTVQTYVLRLRQSLEPERRSRSDTVVVTRDSGYLLRADPENLDALLFDRLVTEGRRALGAGSPQAAARALEEALALWRGPAYAEFRNAEFGAAEAQRLEELRIGALEDRIAADLELGSDRVLIPELEALVTQHPLRERFWGQLMTALYRADRQAEALQAYGHARRVLVDELGIEPGAHLRRLHEAILVQDPHLDRPHPQGVAVFDLPAALDAGDAPFVDREAELAWLRQLWERAASGSGGGAFVTGIRGSGKTRLAAQLAASASTGGAAVLHVRYATGSADADPLAAALAGVGVRAVVDGGESARRLLARAGHPVLVVLDDLHAASAQQLTTVSDVVAAARHLPLLALGLYRDDEPPVAPLPPGPAPIRRLDPLSATAVTEIVSQYPGAAEHVGEITARSGGIPLLVHEFAAEWSRVVATARIDDAVARAEGGRRELLAAQSAMITDVTGLRELERDTVWQLSESSDDGLVRCPFKGLARYEMVDAEFFCGREELVARLTTALVGTGFLGVVGPSGSGKSSVVRAGLLPALADGILPGSERWQRFMLRPGEHPLSELRRVVGVPDAVTFDPLLERAGADGTRVVVFVDQFEEVFTTCRNEDERRAFLRAVTAAASDSESRASVVVALRADYYGRSAAYRDLAAALGANQVLVGPMQPDEMRAAIEIPARRAGLRIESGLVDMILGEVRDQPGALPLLSTALLELWQHRAGRMLTVSAYRHSGGVSGGVARLAERAYGDLTAEQQALARRILLRLAGPGEGDAVVRRRVPLVEIEEVGAQVRAVVNVLADRRLLLVTRGTVEVAHEALLREWPRLRAWLDEDVQGRRLHRHLAGAARDWEDRGRDRGELYRGARLAAGLDWAAAHPDDLNRLERDFIEASRADSDREAADARARERATARTNRRLRQALAVGCVVLVLALMAGGVAAVQRGRAEHEALLALSRRIGAQALLEEHLDRSLLLAVAAVDLHHSAQTRSALLASLGRSPAAVGVLRAGSALLDVAVSPDGRLLAAVDQDGRVLLWDTASLEPVGEALDVGTRGRAASIAFSPDGQLLAVGLGTGRIDGRLRVWEMPDGTVVADENVVGVVATLAFSADDGILAVGMGDTVRLWDTASRRFMPTTFRAAGGGDVDGVALGAGDALVTSSSEAGATHFWDIGSGDLTRTLPLGGPLGLSPDGGTLAIGAGVNAVVVDSVTGNRTATLEGHSAPITRVAFSPDGTSLATVSRDTSAIVWDLVARPQRQILAGHALTPQGVSFGADGETLYTAGLDRTAIVWDLSGDRWLGKPINGPPGTLPWFAYSNDGTMLAAPARDGTVTLWEVAERAPLGGPLEVWNERRPLEFWNENQLESVAFSPDGALLAAGSDSGSVSFWEVRSRRLVTYPRAAGLEQPVTDLEFSPDGELLAAPTGRMFDVETLESFDVLADRTDAGGVGVTFSPDGARVVHATMSGDVVVSDIDQASEIYRVVADPDREATDAAISPDGRVLVAAGGGGSITFWEAEDGRSLGPPVQAHSGPVMSLDFSPDGATLVTAGEDGQVVLWDVATRAQLGSPLPGPDVEAAVARFGPAGAPLVAMYGDGNGLVFDVDPASLRARACAVAGRDLTPAEWEQLIPESPYRTPCADHISDAPTAPVRR